MTMKREPTEELEMKTPKVIDEESPLPPLKKSRKVVSKAAWTEDEWQKLSSLKEKGLGWVYFLSSSPSAFCPLPR
jgi:hypothetical protein